MEGRGRIVLFSFQEPMYLSAGRGVVNGEAYRADSCAFLLQLICEESCLCSLPGLIYSFNRYYLAGQGYENSLVWIVDNNNLKLSCRVFDEDFCLCFGRAVVLLSCCGGPGGI